MKARFIFALALLVAGLTQPAPADAASLHVPVLMLHQVLPKDQWPPSIEDNTSLYTTPMRLKQQLKALYDAGWRSVLAREVARAAKTGERIHGKAFVISVDDGHDTDFNYLYPVLRAVHMRATFFVIGSRIDTPGYMTTAQLRTLSAAGHEIANHTYTHATLTRLSRQQVIEEVRLGSDAVYAAVGRRPVTLAYRGGRYNSAVMDAVRAEGSTWMAFTVEAGVGQSWPTRLHEERLIAYYKWSPATYVAKLYPYR